MNELNIVSKEIREQQNNSEELKMMTLKTELMKSWSFEKTNKSDIKCMFTLIL